MTLGKYEKYKESEISWLGSIPDQWIIKRIKDLCVLQSGDTITANEFIDEEGYPVYGGNGFRGYTSKYNHNGEYILIGRQGALCGNINYATGKFFASEHAVVVYKFKGINTFWLGELLRILNLNQYSLSAAQSGLSVDKIKRVELPFVPSHKEQTTISNYLRKETQAIDKKIALLENKIIKYFELKKALIRETVYRG